MSFSKLGSFWARVPQKRCPARSQNKGKRNAKHENSQNSQINIQNSDSFHNTTNPAIQNSFEPEPLAPTIEDRDSYSNSSSSELSENYKSYMMNVNSSYPPSSTKRNLEKRKVMIDAYKKA